MFNSFATREALFPASILFPRSKICFCYKAETFRVSARHANMAKRGNNYGSMFLETCFLVLPGLNTMIQKFVKKNLDLSPRSTRKPSSGQRSTSQKHVTSMSSTCEPAIWPRDTGQRIPCFYSCQLIITWMSKL